MKKSYILFFNDDDLNNASRKLNRASVESGDIHSGMGSKFKSIKKTGLFSEGFDKISSQIESVSNSLNNVQNTLKVHTESMVTLENSYAKKAEEIEVPQDFVKNDSRKINSLSDISLKKLDGKHVGTNSVSSISDNVSYDVHNTSLGNIMNKNEQFQRVYDDSSVINTSVLENIKGDSTIEKEYDDNYSSNIDNLKSINSGEKARTSIYDDSYSQVSSVNVNSISPGNSTRTNNSSYDDFYNGISLANIESILDEISDEPINSDFKSSLNKNNERDKSKKK